MRRPRFARMARWALRAAGCWPAARARNYPTRSVSIVVPLPPPAGSVDGVGGASSRKKLNDAMGQHFHRRQTAPVAPAAMVGPRTTSPKAEPDGAHGLLLTASIHVITPFLKQRNIPYDVVKDFNPDHADREPGPCWSSTSPKVAGREISREFFRSGPQGSRQNSPSRRPSFGSAGAPSPSSYSSADAGVDTPGDCLTRAPEPALETDPHGEETIQLMVESDACSVAAAGRRAKAIKGRWPVTSAKAHGPSAPRQFRPSPKSGMTGFEIRFPGTGLLGSEKTCRANLVEKAAERSRPRSSRSPR